MTRMAACSEKPSTNADSVARRLSRRGGTSAGRTRCATRRSIVRRMQDARTLFVPRSLEHGKVAAETRVVALGRMTLETAVVADGHAYPASVRTLTATLPGACRVDNLVVRSAGDPAGDLPLCVAAVRFTFSDEPVVTYEPARWAEGALADAYRGAHVLVHDAASSRALGDERTRDACIDAFDEQCCAEGALLHPLEGRPVYLADQFLEESYGHEPRGHLGRGAGGATVELVLDTGCLEPAPLRALLDGVAAEDDEDDEHDAEGEGRDAGVAGAPGDERARFEHEDRPRVGFLAGRRLNNEFVQVRPRGWFRRETTIEVIKGSIHKVVVQDAARRPVTRILRREGERIRSQDLRDDDWVEITLRR